MCCARQIWGNSNIWASSLRRRLNVGVWNCILRATSELARKIHCPILIGKAKLLPMKHNYSSLKLSAAVLSVKYQILRKDLVLRIDSPNFGKTV